MFILRPDLTEVQINKQLRRYRQLLKQHGAEKVSLQIWGKRRLAYPIKKYQEGVYVLTHYTGDGRQVAIIERDMRLGEEVLRYLTIRLDEPFEFEDTEIPEIGEETPTPTTAQTTPGETAEAPTDTTVAENGSTAAETSQQTQETVEKEETAETV
ncbi:MAG TPA: 30S ribosomal protein S6 [Geminocystis sp. M7585_C2015_104]|nr:30S ribosomal protein S6 [Geminocystis sp. M7585_C2015_104]